MLDVVAMPDVPAITDAEPPAARRSVVLLRRVAYAFREEAPLRGRGRREC